MHNLLAKMEAELNKLHNQLAAMQSKPFPELKLKLAAMHELETKQQKVRSLIAKYVAIQAEFKELIGANSVY